MCNFLNFRHCTMDAIQKSNFIIVMCDQQKPDFKHCPSAATDVASSTLSLVYLFQWNCHVRNC
jgi:hypothetical protein